MPARRSPRHLSTAGARAVALGAVLVMLAACATPTPRTPTPYQPAGEGGGGYSGQELEPNRLRITFSGNSTTPRQTVENALLYRAAEVTVHRGFDHFVITDRDTERFTRYGYATPRTSLHFGYGTGFGCCRGSRFGLGYRYGFGPWGYPYYAQPVPAGSRYTAQAVIVMRPGDPPQDNAEAYDARAVMASLGPSLLLPPSPAPTGTAPASPPVPGASPAPTGTTPATPSAPPAMPPAMPPAKPPPTATADPPAPTAMPGAPTRMPPAPSAMPPTSGDPEP
ncbi:DUF5320 domain-containing protein [Roseospira navarrensis]|uniref:DUF5320 domain-containing protein n=1 Tax=Roseospira navarrensis TaxID=140058 RepID=UPI001B863DC7|nr:DUF5320 domain-containing protein [Roseospira navarrensis]